MHMNPSPGEKIAMQLNKVLKWDQQLQRFNDCLSITRSVKERSSIVVMQESISLHFLPLIHILDANPQVHSTVNCTVAECHWFVPSFEHVGNLYLDNDQPQSHLFLEGTVETASFNAFLMPMQINAGWWGCCRWLKGEWKKTHSWLWL